MSVACSFTQSLLSRQYGVLTLIAVSHMHSELLGSPLHGFNSLHEPKDRTSDTRYGQPVVNDGRGEVMQHLCTQFVVTM